MNQNQQQNGGFGGNYQGFPGNHNEFNLSEADGNGNAVANNRAFWEKRRERDQYVPNQMKPDPQNECHPISNPDPAGFFQNGVGFHCHPPLDQRGQPLNDVGPASLNGTHNHFSFQNPQSGHPVPFNNLMDPSNNFKIPSNNAHRDDDDGGPPPLSSLQALPYGAPNEDEFFPDLEEALRISKNEAYRNGELSPSHYNDLENVNESSQEKLNPNRNEREETKEDLERPKAREERKEDFEVGEREEPWKKPNGAWNSEQHQENFSFVSFGQKKAGEYDSQAFMAESEPNEVENRKFEHQLPQPLDFSLVDLPVFRLLNLFDQMELIRFSLDSSSRNFSMFLILRAIEKQLALQVNCEPIGQLLMGIQAAREFYMRQIRAEIQVPDGLNPLEIRTLFLKNMQKIIGFFFRDLLDQERTEQFFEEFRRYFEIECQNILEENKSLLNASYTKMESEHAIALNENAYLREANQKLQEETQELRTRVHQMSQEISKNPEFTRLKDEIEEITREKKEFEATILELRVENKGNEKKIAESLKELKKAKKELRISSTESKKKMGETHKWFTEMLLKEKKKNAKELSLKCEKFSSSWSKFEFRISQMSKQLEAAQKIKTEHNELMFALKTKGLGFDEVRKESNVILLDGLGNISFGDGNSKNQKKAKKSIQTSLKSLELGNPCQIQSYFFRLTPKVALVLVGIIAIVLFGVDWHLSNL